MDLTCLTLDGKCPLLPVGVLAIAYNHEGESGLRIHLRVALSPDDGTNWYHLAEIEKGDAVGLPWTSHITVGNCTDSPMVTLSGRAILPISLSNTDAGWL